MSSLPYQTQLSQAVKLHETGHIKRAAECYRAILKTHPHDFDASHLLAVTELQLGNITTSFELFEQVLQHHAHCTPEFFFNRGVVLQALQQHKAAITSYDRAISLKPDYAAAHYNAGFSLLLTGQFERGWQEYEWRRHATDSQKGIPAFTEPQWLGNFSLQNKTIFLHAEQGIGDAIQFCRYISYVAQLGARIILGIPTALKPLLTQLKHVAHLTADAEPIPHFDCFCPLMSLPLALHNYLNTPPLEIPYLHSPPLLSTTWQARIKQINQNKQTRIGIAWSGGINTANDQHRSIHLDRLAPLFSAPATFFCLQKEVRDYDEAALHNFSNLHFMGMHLNDFAETAALIEEMDLIITVDTSVAHLAGAMGKPLWLLLPYAPDWRWLLNTEKSAWYPTAHLFRQPKPNDWDSVIKIITNKLTTHPLLTH